MNERRKPYPFDQIEPKWQAIWDERGAFRTPNPGEQNFDPAKPKFYILDMFPYPSGAGLHVGHPEGYTATDIVARYKRMCGFNVLHPMGWDAFGLPAEQYAIKTGQHPAITTRDNIAKFKAQLKQHRLLLRLGPRGQHDRSALFQMDAVDFPEALQFLVQSGDATRRNRFRHYTGRRSRQRAACLSSLKRL